MSEKSITDDISGILCESACIRGFAHVEKEIFEFLRGTDDDFVDAFFWKLAEKIAERKRIRAKEQA